MDPELMLPISMVLLADIAIVMGSFGAIRRGPAFRTAFQCSSCALLLILAFGNWDTVIFPTVLSVCTGYFWWKFRDDDDDETKRRRRRMVSKLKSWLPQPKAFVRPVPAQS